MVLPVSAFTATVYVTSRLSNESELAVIQATGMSPWRLARPVFMFGLLIGILMFGLTAYLVPKTGTITKDREFELSQSLGAKFCAKGRFNTLLRASHFLSERSRQKVSYGMSFSLTGAKKMQAIPTLRSAHFWSRQRIKQFL